MTDTSFLSRRPPPATPPKPERTWAVFLDLDGTLLDIAPAPDRVVVPEDLVHDLSTASAALDGALAIVSGRKLSDIDNLLAPLSLPAGSEHGAIVRLPDGKRNDLDTHVPAEWIDAITQEAIDKAGVIVEHKTHGVVVHYRRSAHYEDFCKGLCTDLVAQKPDEFEVLQAKMAFEIRPKAATKGRSVDVLMREAPFVGRRPIFVGDDVTDEDGFRAAGTYGGEGLNVFNRFGGRPHEVRQWLKSFAAS
ncbi:MAG: trehalose-phosphatase [Alphaproteobacteria bacterium]|nr:trehalose-phosphatase [Alphaproteobacteria bacterium]